MDYKEIKRLTLELEKKQNKINKLDKDKELIQLEMEELQDNLRSAMMGDTSYKEVEENLPEME